MSRRDRKARGERLPPFVPLLKATLESPAWRAMSHRVAGMARNVPRCQKPLCVLEGSVQFRPT